MGILDATVDVLRSKKSIYSNFDVLKVNRHRRGVGNKTNPVARSKAFDVL